jgi:hypothetical protein
LPELLARNLFVSNQGAIILLFNLITAQIAFLKF